MSRVEAICISDKKGDVKKPIGKAEFKENWGIINDAHAGNWHRQVSILAGESIDLMKVKLPQLQQGAFAENIITRGINLKNIVVGDRLIVNDKVILEVTQIGKECHNNGCTIKTQTGDCIMPVEGLFARVVCGGFAKTGDHILIYCEDNSDNTN